MKRTKTFQIALGGLCLALTLIFMAGASFLPGIEMTLFLLSSVFTVIMIIETGVGGGAALFAAACILGFILIPNKLALIPYACIFGYYGIVKYFIEKLGSGIMQITVKTIYFAAVSCIGLIFFKNLLAGSIHFPDFPLAVLIIGGVIMLLLYDFVLTYIIRYYNRRFRGSNPDSFKLS